MKNLLVTFIAFSISCAPAYALDYTITEGEKVSLETLDKLKAKNLNEGDVISFRVTDDVFAPDGKTVLIKAGTTAEGDVADIDKAGMLGQKGEMTIRVNSTKSINGDRVPLRANLNREGNSKVGTVIALTLLLTPLFLLMKGKEAEIPAGTKFKAYVDRETLVSIPDSEGDPVAVSE